MSVLRISVGLVAWGGSLVGALSVAEWPGDLGHGICGPWGCGPPLQALLACHLAWLVALAPPAGWLIRSRNVPVATQRGIGMSLIAVGVLALSSILAHEVLVWWPQASEWQRDYFWQRYIFSIATAVDFPAVQVLLVGLTIWLTGQVRENESQYAVGSPSSSEESAVDGPF